MPHLPVKTPPLQVPDEWRSVSDEKCESRIGYCSEYGNARPDILSQRKLIKYELRRVHTEPPTGVVYFDDGASSEILSSKESESLWHISSSNNG